MPKSNPNSRVERRLELQQIIPAELQHLLDEMVGSDLTLGECAVRLLQEQKAHSEDKREFASLPGYVETVHSLRMQ